MTNKIMTEKNPKKIQNDLPDVEKRVEQKKTQKDNGATDGEPNPAPITPGTTPN